MPQFISHDDLFKIETNGKSLQVFARGGWTRENAGRLDQQLKKIITADLSKNKMGSGAQVTLDLSSIESLDTFGAYLICSTSQTLREEGFSASLEGVREHHAPLLDEIHKALQIKDEPKKERGAFLCFVDEVLVKGIAGIGNDIQTLLSFLGLVTVSMFGMILHPSRFSMTSFVHHIEYIGFRAIPIISLICFLIGSVIMQQGIVQLSKFGADSFAVSMTAVLSLREVGVLLTAILVAGRSSSAFTAEIGSMKMREEIDAMKTLGIDPIDTLVIPRILALIVILPLLVFIADIMCLIGGGVMAYFYLGMSVEAYIESLHKWITLNHFFAGLLKTPFIAVAIGIVGCVEGLKVEGSAESLGAHVTSAVVKSIFLVMILDALFAILLAAIEF